MRSSLSCCVLVAVVSCGGRAAPSAALPPSNGAPVAVAASEPVRNSTPLRADARDRPLSPVSLAFVAPELGGRVMSADARSYRVRVIVDAAPPDIVALELGLDAGRPRRVSLAEPTIALGELLSADAELTNGAHWLFAAAISASDLVPSAARGGPATAKARRFFIGSTSDEAAGPRAAVWLRRPEGSYNGTKNSESVLFEAIVFSALGAVIDVPSTITLESAAVSGKLDLASPFVLRDVPSGLYEVTASAAAALASTSHFTVNRELSGGS